MKDADEGLIEEESTEDACGIAKDTAVSILRAMRPVVAAIPDAETKQSVTDALLASLRGKSAISGIQQATADAAKANALAASKTSYDKICESQQEAYASRNPHSPKKEV